MDAALETGSFDVDAGQARRAALGLVVLQADETIENDARRIVPSDGVRVYVSRIRSAPLITTETLNSMAGDLAASAGMLPDAVTFDVIGYGCTSASMAIGEEQVFANIRQAKPDVTCTTPITAAFAAFDAFKARRIGVLTPYPADVNRIVADYIAARGFHVPVFGSFNADRDTVVARITPQSIEQGVREIIKHGEVDAIFVSCTSVRLMQDCAELEKHLGIPLTSSNHAMAWHALRLAGIDDNLGQFGSLYDLPLPPQSDNK